MSTVIQPPKDKAERDARLDLVMATIEANPGHWDQNQWHCGTCHCFAGFTQLIAYDLPPDQCVLDDFGDEVSVGELEFGGEYHDTLADAMDYLGFKAHDEWWDVDFDSPSLFLWSNTLADLRRIVSEIKQTPYEPAP